MNESEESYDSQLYPEQQCLAEIAERSWWDISGELPWGWKTS